MSCSQHYVGADGLIALCDLNPKSSKQARHLPHVLILLKQAAKFAGEPPCANYLNPAQWLLFLVIALIMFLLDQTFHLQSWSLSFQISFNCILDIQRRRREGSLPTGSLSLWFFVHSETKFLPQSQTPHTRIQASLISKTPHPYVVSGYHVNRQRSTTSTI